nr:hypothetical protein [uncultured Rhodopila sp.]
MASEVEVTITGIVRGKTFVVPYSHHQGLQFVVVGGVRTERPVIYEVPYYEVRVGRGGTYAAVRFGLQNNGSVPKIRHCDAGLSHAHHCTPSWIPTYSPHSFRGGSRPGAWQLLPGKGFLIHEGADTRKDQVGGSLGCVEILDGRWNYFLAEIERLAGAPVAAISASHKLQVSIESAHYPIASLV